MMQKCYKNEQIKYAENVAQMNILLNCGSKGIIDYDNNTTNILPLVNKHRAGNKLQFRPFLGEVSNLCYRAI